MAFVDVRMPPGWDGIETIARIWEKYPELQVVVCTAYSDYSWDDLIAKIGQSDRLVILKKPFDTVEALQLANALTAKWDLLQQVHSRIGSLELTVSESSARLRESQEHFRLISENVTDLISVVDVRGRHQYSSPSFRRVLGYEPAEVQQACWFDWFHPDDNKQALQVWKESLARGSVCVLEQRLRHKDGSWRAVESQLSPVRNARGEVEHTLVHIWEQVLDVRPIGIHDNFFDLGGHSLAATRVVSWVISQFQLEIPLQSLFQSPTVAEMAVVITEHQGEQVGKAELDRMLRELELLSDEDAKRLWSEEHRKN